MSQRRGVRLQVARARPGDVGRGTARLSPGAMQALGVREGEVIEIVGKRRTAALALRLSYEDRGLELLRLDGLQRANADVGIGDFAEVCGAEWRAARSVELAPAQPHVQLAGPPEALRRTLEGRALAAGDLVSTSTYRGDAADDASRALAGHPSYGLQEIRLRVVSTAPPGIVRITPETELALRAERVEPDVRRRADVTYDDLGGLGDTIRQVREMIELPLRHPELFQRLGVGPPRGVLLYGPPGTGKTLLARAVASEADARFFHIGGPEVMAPYQGESEQRLRLVFEQAAAQAPSIIFIDEIDAIAPKREEAIGETERRLVAQLLMLMDGLEPRRNVLVIAATNLVDSLDEAIRRPGRFDREIVIGVPDRGGRREILAIHTRGMPLGDDVDLDELARTTHGFVGADLAALVREAALDALRRSLSSLDLETREIAPEVLAGLRVTRDDFAGARKRVHPSAMREIMIQTPDVTWDDVGGLDRAKRELRDGIELPLRHPDAFRRLGIRPAKGFLLFGPPGTGKTLLARAVARSAEANFLAAKSSDLLSKWYGESERQVSRLFARARQVAPAVIFLDEVDSLAPARGAVGGEPAVTDRVVNTLLAEMDGLEALHDVVVVGATNRPTLLDPALLRPGRFDELVYVPVPDRPGRRHILRILTGGMPLGDDVDLDALAERTQGYTGADLMDLVRRAGLRALRESPDAGRVAMPLFEQALRETRASVTPAMEREYEQLLEDLKRESPRGGRRIGFGVGGEGGV